MSEPAATPDPEAIVETRRRSSRQTRPPARQSEGSAASADSPIPPCVAAVRTAGSEAWSDFLETYTPFILGCIRRLAEDYDERMDIYLHVCARLYADDCRRIRQFHGGTPEKPCKFTTWLAAVTLNLTREWIRQMRGRRRIFRVIARMSMPHRLVFRYHYWEGLGAAEIRQLLRHQHGLEVGAAELEAIFTEVRCALGSDKRWRLLTREAAAARHLSLDGPAPRSPDRSLSLQVSSAAPGSELVTTQQRALEALAVAIQGLPKAQRESLDLRFREGLSAKEIARRLDIDNYKRVYDLQAKALVQIRTQLRQSGWELGDFPRCGELELEQ